MLPRSQPRVNFWLSVCVRRSRSLSLFRDGGLLVTMYGATYRCTVSFCLQFKKGDKANFSLKMTLGLSAMMIPKGRGPALLEGRQGPVRFPNGGLAGVSASSVWGAPAPEGWPCVRTALPRPSSDGVPPQSPRGPFLHRRLHAHNSPPSGGHPGKPQGRGFFKFRFQGLFILTVSRGQPA